MSFSAIARAGFQGSFIKVLVWRSLGPKTGWFINNLTAAMQ